MTRVLGYAWLAVLGLALLLSAAGTYARSMELDERVWGCDSAGYLTMAKEVRRAASRGQAPDFGLETAHTRLLIECMQAHQVPPPLWDELVAPHAHHYFPRAGRVGVQYPPGTGVLLAAFPPGKAEHGLNRTVVVIFLAAGLLVLGVAARTQTWAAAGGAVLALQFGLTLPGDRDDYNFSINAMLVPLLLAFAALLLALFLRTGAGKPRAAAAVAFLGGACFGFAILVRVAITLLLPGALVLLLGASRRIGLNRSAVAFACGVGLCGVAPLLLHQQRLAGAWYLPTYGPTDSSPPSLAVLPANVPFYFGGGAGSRYNWVLLAALVGLAGVASRAGRAAGPCPPLTGRRVTLAALVLWGGSTAYFLTHRVQVGYYPLPALFAAVIVLGLGGLAVEWLARGSGEGSASAKGGRLHRLALTAALVPGFVAVGWGWASRPHAPLPAEASAYRPDIPAELTDERAWVFADMLTGTLWYHAERPAYKIGFTDAATRALVYRFVFERGEPQYVIRDSETMGLLLKEIEQLGGALEPRGEVDHCPYYLVRWPERGPESANAR